MNREILFRGKRIDNSEWIEGFYFELCHDGINTPCIGFEPLSANDYGEIYDSCYEMVNPSTVGQCTGLTDKNGVRIFEGDILDCTDRIVYVRWHDKFAQWDSEFIQYQGELCSNGITPVEWKYRAVVIGNIHDGKGGQYD